MAKTVHIGAAVIDRLLHNEQAKKEFPFLANPPMRKRGGCCGKAATTTVNYNLIKRNIASLPDTRRVKLRKLIGAATVKLNYKEGNKNRSAEF